MAMKIGGYSFEGPYSFTSSLREQGGIYVVLTGTGQRNAPKVLDIGEASGVKSRVEGHDRKDCWERN
jgi:hypothetical protein